MKIANIVLAIAGSSLLLSSANAQPSADAKRDSPFVFQDVAAKMGITKATQGMMAHAAAWGDVDRDGKMDLWIGSFADRKIEVYQAGGAAGPVANMLLLQRKGAFVPADNPAIAWKGRATGSVMADFDNDGWTDLYVSNNGRLGKENLLYRNNRGKLELVENAGANLKLPDVSRGVSVFDFDGDGRLDILVLATVGKGESMLFQNQGKMQFKRSKALPANLTGLGMAIGDLTGNGWPDVFVGGPNRLFVNRGRGRFREATELNLGWEFKAEDNAQSCGAAMGDFDRDGRLDLLIGTHTKRPWATPVPMRLFRNLGSTVQQIRLAEVTKQVGLRPLPMKTPHVEIRDFDNDGWPDLYSAVVVYKDGKTHPAIYKNLGVKSGELPRFQETAFLHRPEYPEEDDYHPGMRTGEFYEGLAAGRKLMYFAPGPSTDFDGDGRLDLMLPNWFSTQPSLLLKNETKTGNYLDVVVVGSGKVNRDGIGSMVRAYPAGKALAAGGGGFIASEQIASGYGYASGQVPVAHLGLGQHESCDVVVTLPHGSGQIVRRNVKSNQRLTVDASADAVNKSASSIAWPPKLDNAVQDVVTLKTRQFLDVPSEVAAVRGEPGAAPFVMAKTAPTVTLAFHGNLGPDPTARRLWSSWGDICLARDGTVYVGIGDHHHDADGDGRCFIYRWDVRQKSLKQIVDMNQVVAPRPGQPAWTKVHAKIDEGADGKIYFCCTLNAGNRAGDDNYKWTKQLPGAQLYQYDPKTGKTTVYANLPPKRCTATSLLDTKRNVWWCNLEAGRGDALYGLNMSTKEVVHKTPDGAVAFNRCFALAQDGSIHFNGADGNLMRLDTRRKRITNTAAKFLEAPGMRAATRESKRGEIFGSTYKTNQLFRYRPQDGKLEMLGATWGSGQYTTVMVLSPDERFVYYLPGAHGQAFKYGTPVIQYEIATRTRKVLAFLAPAMESQIDYVPGGTYGIKLSRDGGVLFVNFNGHAADAIRPANMKSIGFGLCSFAAISIPESER